MAELAKGIERRRQELLGLKKMIVEEGAADAEMLELAEMELEECKESLLSAEKVGRCSI